VGGLGAATAASANYRTTVHPHTDWGPWQGWGTSLSWWANAFGDRDDLADLLFTRKTVPFRGRRVPGLGLNIVRYNVGGSSPTMDYTAGMSDAKRIDGFWTGPGRWDWSVDARQVAMLRKAKGRGADTFEMFSVSPMYWMTANWTSRGASQGDRDNLLPQHRADHATYLATVAAHARDHWGIRFGSVEPFNEPGAYWWSPATSAQEGCHYDVSTMSSILPVARRELDRVGLSGTILASPDENVYTRPTSGRDPGNTLDTWRALSPTARGLLGRVNTHGYQGSGGDRAALYRAAVRGGSRVPIWNSETGDGDVWVGNPATTCASCTRAPTCTGRRSTATSPRRRGSRWCSSGA
jgi:galactan endo-1,6-beta-galactosidase